MRIILFFLLITKISFLSSQNIDKKLVLDSIKKYAKIQLTSGSITVLTKFKAAIAEDTNIHIIQYKYCIKSNKLSFLKIPILNGGNELLYTPKNILSKNKLTKTYIDHNKDKPYNTIKYKPPIFEYFINYLDSNLFNQLESRKFSLATISEKYVFTNMGSKLEFSKKDYSLLSYKIWDISKYGVGYDEFTIIENLTDSLLCNNFIFDEKRFVEGFVKEKTKKSFQNSNKKNNENYLDSIKSITTNVDSVNFFILDFFYQSCMPCIQSFPDLIKLSNVKNIKVVGIDPIPYDTLNINKFKIRYKLNYEIIGYPFAFKLNSFFNKEKIFPFVVVLDKKGVILKTFLGFEENLFQKIILITQSK